LSVSGLDKNRSRFFAKAIIVLSAFLFLPFPDEKDEYKMSNLSQKGSQFLVPSEKIASKENKSVNIRSNIVARSS
jgi:hypothetical protein